MTTTSRCFDVRTGGASRPPSDVGCRSFDKASLRYCLAVDSLRLAFLPHRATDKDFGRELATSVEDESQKRSAVPCLAIWAEIRLSKRTSKKSERD